MVRTPAAPRRFSTTRLTAPPPEEPWETMTCQVDLELSSVSVNNFVDETEAWRIVEMASVCISESFFGRQKYGRTAVLKLSFYGFEMFRMRAPKSVADHDSQVPKDDDRVAMLGRVDSEMQTESAVWWHESIEEEDAIVPKDERTNAVHIHDRALIPGTSGGGIWVHGPGGKWPLDLGAPRDKVSHKAWVTSKPRRPAKELVEQVVTSEKHPTLLGTPGPSEVPPATRFQRRKPQLHIKTSLEGESFQMFTVKSPQSPQSPQSSEQIKRGHLLTPRVAPPRASSHDAKKTGKLPGLKTMSIDQDSSSKSPAIRRTSLTVQDDKADFSFPACSIEASRPAQRTISRPRFCGRRFSTSS
eukprot:Skav236511  [mRNA]  locus=scaffold78:503302:508793:+ [translate_table: standard]